MKKYAVASIVVVIAILSTNICAQVVKIKSTYQPLSVKTRVGSGVVIRYKDKYSVISSSHVLYHSRDEKLVTHCITAPAGYKTCLRLEAVNSLNGLALLSFIDSPPINISAIELDQGHQEFPTNIKLSNLIVHGYAYDNDMQPNEDRKVKVIGRNSKRAALPLAEEIFEFEGYNDFGMSGGAILSPDKSLVGVISHQYLLRKKGQQPDLQSRGDANTKENLVGLAISAPSVLKWLESLSQDQESNSIYESLTDQVNGRSVLSLDDLLWSEQKCQPTAEIGGDGVGVGGDGVGVGGDGVGIGGDENDVPREGNTCSVRLRLNMQSKGTQPWPWSKPKWLEQLKYNLAKRAKTAEIKAVVDLNSGRMIPVRNLYGLLQTLADNKFRPLVSLNDRLNFAYDRENSDFTFERKRLQRSLEKLECSPEKCENSWYLIKQVQKFIHWIDVEAVDLLMPKFVDPLIDDSAISEEAWEELNGINLEASANLKASLRRISALGSQPLAATGLVSVGQFHSCAYDGRAESSPVCWGKTEHGATDAPPIRNVLEMESGAWHTCALYDASKDNRRVQCWGYKRFGIKNVPLFEGQILTLSSGKWHACMLVQKRDHTSEVICWGASSEGESNAPKDLRSPNALFAGDGFTCVRHDEGKVRCFGRISGEWTKEDFPRLKGGSGMTCEEGRKGKPDCWSNLSSATGGVIKSSKNIRCELKDSTLTCETPAGTPVKPERALVEPYDFSVGLSHVCALDAQGIHCFASNELGRSNGQIDAPEEKFVWGPNAISLQRFPQALERLADFMHDFDAQYLGKIALMLRNNQGISNLDLFVAIMLRDYFSDLNHSYTPKRHMFAMRRDIDGWIESNPSIEIKELANKDNFILQMLMLSLQTEASLYEPDVQVMAKKLSDLIENANAYNTGLTQDEIAALKNFVVKHQSKHSLLSMRSKTNLKLLDTYASSKEDRK